MTYRFDEKQHLHELLIDGDWKKLTGVTTILGVIAKPALIQWSANMAVDYICDHIKELITGTKDEQNELLKEAKYAHRKKKEDAGQKGTDVHAIIEQEIKEAIKDKGFISEFKFRDNDLPQVKHFLDWAVKNKVKFLESEKNIFSKEMFVGGICDFVCEIDGEVWLGDIKTGSGIYAEAFWQMGGYEICFSEMGLYPQIKGYVVVNLKKDGTFDEKRSISNEENKEAFRSCLNIYRVQEKIKSLIN